MFIFDNYLVTFNDVFASMNHFFLLLPFDVHSVWLGIFGVAFSAFEYFIFTNRKTLGKRKPNPDEDGGDFGFDPLNLYEIRGANPSAKVKRIS